MHTTHIGANKLHICTRMIRCYWPSDGLDIPRIRSPHINFGLAYCHTERMKSNLSKTKVMCLWQPRFCPGGSPINVEIGDSDSTINIVNFTRFLGIVLDDRLSFTNHTQYVISKAAKQFYMLLQLKCVADVAVTVNKYQRVHIVLSNPFFLFIVALWLLLLNKLHFRCPKDLRHPNKKLHIQPAFTS